MVPFHPHRDDGFFLFLGPLGPVTGEGRLEIDFLPGRSRTGKGMSKGWSSLLAPAVHCDMKREAPDYSTTRMVFLRYPESDSSDEEDSNGSNEAEENKRKKARRGVISPGISGHAEYPTHADN